MPSGATPLKALRTGPPSPTTTGGEAGAARRALAPTLLPPQPGATIRPAVEAAADVTGAPDQTAQLEVPGIRGRPSDRPVPPGVTLLHDDLGLPPRERLTPHEGVIDLTGVGSGPFPTTSAPIGDPDVTPTPQNRASVIDEPGDLEPGDLEPGDLEPGDLEPGDLEPGDLEPGDLEPGDLEPGDLEPGDLEPGDLEPSDLDDEPPRGGSSASTIADLLRHGGSGLFFKR